MSAAHITPLPELQEFMAGALQQKEPLPACREIAARAPGLVTGNARLSPVEQLDIYREQFWLRHVGALTEDYAALHHLLGHDGFHALCEAYLAAHPPASFTLRDLGANLPAFVARTEPYASDVLLADTARLEWAFVDAFDAPDAPPLDPQSIASAPEDAWGGAKVVLHPSVQRLALGHASHELRAAVKRGESPPRPDPSPTCVVVYRGPESLQYIDIEPMAFDLLDALARGVALAPACEEVASRAGVSDASELEPRVGAWFQAWASYGWVSRVEF